MPYEVFNKHGSRIRVGIGRMIPPEQQENFPDAESFGNYLRKMVYEMPEPETYTPRSELLMNRKADRIMTG
jgi:hypothetical protein